MGHHAIVRAAIRELFSTSNPANADRPEVDIHAEKLAALKAQELRDMMALLSFLEACFRLDYECRKRLKLKDPLSKALIKLFNRKRNKAGLMDDIVKGWLKEQAISHRDYDRINSAFQLRHWLAHGQYWSPAKIKPHDLVDLAEFIEGLINADLFRTGNIDMSGKYHLVD